MDVFDKKRFVDSEDAYSEVLQRMIEEGNMPSLRVLFSHTKVAMLSDEDKKGKSIIQFSFFVTGRQKLLMLMDRTDAGHQVTTGHSILVSWSPCVERFPSGASYPICEEDVQDIFSKEIVFPSIRPPHLRYVGFARNEPSRGRVYYFYIFEAKYDDSEEVLARQMEVYGAENVFVKDKEAFLGFWSAEDLLNSGSIANRVDRAVLEVLTKDNHLKPYRSQDGRCVFVPWRDDESERSLLPGCLLR